MTGHILRMNCLLKHFIEEKIEGGIEVTGTRGRIRKQLADNLKGKKAYWKLKDEALVPSLWKTCSGRGCGSVVGQATK